MVRHVKFTKSKRKGDSDEDEDDDDDEVREASDVLHLANIGVICSMEDGAKKTEQFSVQVCFCNGCICMVNLRLRTACFCRIFF